MARSAWIKGFAVEQVLKNNGIEIQVDDDGKQFGDLYVAKTGITWCDGKCARASGTQFTFDELSLLASYKKVAIKAAKEAAKSSE